MGLNAGGVEALAFLPPKVTIASGDTVTFDWSRGDPHNAYFPAGQRPPEFITPEPQQNGPPTLAVHPQVIAPTQPSGGSYDGSGPLNSGLFAPKEDGLPELGASFSVAFTKPGTYPYLCSVHGGVDEQGNLVGMVGEITVVQRQAQPLPNTGVENNRLTFAETGYSLDGEFLRYWQANGGLPIFGMPISSARQANGRVGQVLERARFELHPENAAPYNVLLSHLGVEALARQGRDWTTFAKAAPDTPHYFAETGHAIAPEFWDYWRTHGLEMGDAGVSFRESLALFGYPISKATIETNASGHRVLTQWTERARFELHTGNGAPNRVLLGLLGAELHRGSGVR
jgi:plastocyanin